MKNKTKIFRRVLLVAIGMLMLTSLTLGWWLFQKSQKTSLAAGSNLYIRDDQKRINIDETTANLAKIPRKSIFYSYAKAGESIDFASSAVGIGDGDIKYFGPDGSSAKCLDQGENSGKIENVTQEKAGPLPAQNGFKPCVVKIDTPQKVGIWKFEFISPHSDTSHNPELVPSQSEWTQASDVYSISAWNVTVFNAQNQEQKGRTYSKYLSMYLPSFDEPLFLKFYVITKEGYQYLIDTNGIRPAGFIFFSNNKGFENKDGSPLYKSVNLVGENLDNSLPDDVLLHSPALPDDGSEFTHKVFLEEPDKSMPSTALSSEGTEWLYNPPAKNLNASDFDLQNKTGNSGQVSVDQTAKFTFKSPYPLNYTLNIDTNQDGVFGNLDDRVLTGTGQAGQNEISWDLKDAKGKTVSVSDKNYKASLKLQYGEVHFPFLDVENMDHGIKIERLAPAGSNPWQIYFNDTEIQTNQAKPNVLATGQEGLSSENGAHAYQDYFGNIKGIDTWSYLASDPTITSFLVKGTDLAVTATHAPSEFLKDEKGSFTFDLSNNGPYAVKDAQFESTIQNLDDTKLTCTTTSGKGTCSVLPDKNKLLVSMDVGDKISIRREGSVSGEVKSKSTGIAKISTPQDIPDTNLNNNQASDEALISQPNRPPKAIEDLDFTNQNTPKSVDVLANDSDPDNNLNPATLATTQNPANGQAKVENGKITYTPNNNFNGKDNFQYKICDSAGLCDNTQVTIDVNKQYLPPEAIEDNAQTDQNKPIDIKPLENDKLQDIRLPSSWAISEPAKHGSYEIKDDTLKYTPNNNYAGPDLLKYKVCDSSNTCSEAKINIQVKPVNLPPDAQDDQFAGKINTPLAMQVLSNDSDPDDNLDPTSLKINPQASAANGNLSIDNGKVNYIPNKDFTGNDGFDYAICDKQNLCDNAHVSLTISGDVTKQPATTIVNLPPVANNDVATTDKNKPVDVDVLNNDSDPENDLNRQSLVLIDPPSHGNALISSGKFQYIPNPDYIGGDTFTYQICDSKGLCAKANVNITVKDNIKPPIANPDIATTLVNTPVTIDILNNDTGELIGPQNVKITDTPKRGGAVLGVSSKAIYTPESNFVGSDTFKYEICNLPSQCSSTDVKIQVYAPVTSTLPRTGGPTSTAMIFGISSAVIVGFFYMATRKRLIVQLV